MEFVGGALLNLMLKILTVMHQQIQPGQDSNYLYPDREM